eukprot:11813973-Alexandrium_andersonii.AAC.1
MPLGFNPPRNTGPSARRRQAPPEAQRRRRNAIVLPGRRFVGRPALFFEARALKGRNRLSSARPWVLAPAAAAHLRL